MWCLFCIKKQGEVHSILFLLRLEVWVKYGFIYIIFKKLHYLLTCLVFWGNEWANSTLEATIILKQPGNPSDLFIPIVISDYNYWYFINILNTPQEIMQSAKFVDKSSF